ncbi:heat-shock protein Hsp20 [Vibrio alginolyticus]|uniref:Hsp20/alpha crystallin family protein n=1 Tax=Vibrio TaxID=662 RepID=UPI0003ED939E|nr:MULTISPECIES: Hsp20/alpha crystallin family protein [Vibrio]EKF9437436.1 Hsp20/alpha crystallin family protein [Vibrio cholerae]TBT35791.1 Hsp20/alpha crystallin family protein [Vibrio parahaemolyticus]BCB43169.1 heat-shock protein Hsp20 [Vibrio alginolyticus]AHI98731.1 Heat shock protein, Hsp20 family [Vibrio parahaemolyticus UCM-V493]BCB47770.1 heat-shock protein Hsp20 [Vibrio alginolyticus]
MSNSKTVQPAESAAEVKSELALLPSVDIYEDAKNITLKADLPGVSKEGLSIELDGETLTIEARLNTDMPESMTTLYADVNGNRYVRRFSLSSELEVGKINAEMKNGELTLIIPKREDLQPRKIEVKVG